MVGGSVRCVEEVWLGCVGVLVDVMLVDCCAACTAQHLHQGWRAFARQVNPLFLPPPFCPPSFLSFHPVSVLHVYAMGRMNHTRTKNKHVRSCLHVQVEAHNERLQLRNYGTVTQRNAHLLIVSLFNQEVSLALHLGGAPSTAAC